eukprot:TRINITY_DN7388_c0_g1_i2.p1 TRINITY_DN7388_c0_g1~~TRINITY_DN7388_c0_g1_i2.p1  ORF type:complete len:333 (-),score=18.87 TRINITY_DN7388_c0_g1_i2:60-1058(-)
MKCSRISVSYSSITRRSQLLVPFLFAFLPGSVCLSNNYTNAVLRASLVIQPPYVFYDPTKVGNDRFSGFAVDFFSAALQQLNQNVTWVGHLTDSFGSPVNGSWTGAVGELQSGQADIVIASLTITAARRSVISFTSAYVDVGLEIMILRPDATFGVWAFLDPFKPRLWGMIVVTMAAMTLAFFIIDRLSPYGHHNHESRSLSRFQHCGWLCNIEMYRVDARSINRVRMLVGWCVVFASFVRRQLTGVGRRLEQPDGVNDDRTRAGRRLRHCNAILVVAHSVVGLHLLCDHHYFDLHSESDGFLDGQKPGDVNQRPRFVAGVECQCRRGPEKP